MCAVVCDTLCVGVRERHRKTETETEREIANSIFGSDGSSIFLFPYKSFRYLIEYLAKYIDPDKIWIISVLLTDIL